MSKKKQSKPSTATSKTGRPTPEEVASLLPQASPDDPIYTRGFVIGGRFSKRTPPSSDDEKKENKVARVTYKGLRKPDDPIYKQTLIVIGGGARPSSARPSHESKSAKPKPKK